MKYRIFIFILVAIPLLSGIVFSQNKTFLKPRNEILGFCLEFKKNIIKNRFLEMRKFFSKEFLASHKQEVTKCEFYKRPSIFSDNQRQRFFGTKKELLIILEGAKFKIIKETVEGKAEISVLNNGEDRKLATLRKLFLVKENGKWVIDDWILAPYAK